jgi:hypothetical protein
MMPEARVEWPNIEDQIRMANLVRAKEPVVEGRWGFVDGKNYHVMESGNALIQNAMYNGWLHDVFVTNCACFSADGVCVWAKLNYYGSWNDGEMSRTLQRKLQDPLRNAPGHGLLADTAFPVAGDMHGLIFTPLKENDLERVPLRLRFALTTFSNAVTSMRQSAEWGMGCVPKVYRVLEKKLSFDQVKRGRLLRVLYKLYNYRVRTCGISQIKSYFEE